MWEYNRFEFKFKTNFELVNKLNNIGIDNWEIIFYQETKPPKFNDDWISIIIVKRLKTA